MTSKHPDSVLQHRPFVLFWFARVATTTGYQMLVVAIGWQLYELTGNPLDLGLVGLAQFIPGFLLVLVIGQVTDRYDRRFILSTCQAVEAVMAAVLLMAAVSGAISRELILGIAFVMGGARAFELTAMQTIVPSLVPLPLVPRAVAGSATANQSATIVGPALGGFIYAVSPLAVYSLCCALFVLAGMLVIFVRIERATPQREPFTLGTFFAGFGFIKRSPIILGAISLDLFAVLLGGATALLPVFARDIHAAGPWALGLLRAAPAVGALGMAIMLTRWSFDRNAGRIMFAAVAAFGLSTIVFALSSSFIVALMALVVLGASDMVSVVIRMTLVQLGTPDEMRGRVTAVNALFIGASNQLGEFRAGAAAAWLGAVPTVLIGGIGTLVIVALWLWLFPPLARVNRLEDVKPESAPKSAS
jgi:MFS family permease